MKAKTFLSCAVFGILGSALAITAILNTQMFKVSSTVKYGEKEVSLEINASKIASASGTLTLNGNEFTYENFTVVGDAINLGVGSRIYANEASGSSVAANGLRGGGFNNLKIVASAAGDATGNLNGASLDIELAASETFNNDFDSNAFDFSITSGALSISKMILSYTCEYDAAPAKQKVLFVGSDNMSVSKWETTYAEALNAVEGVTAEYDHFTTGSFTFLQIGNLETNYANKAQEFRDMLASDSWDAVVYQLSRRVTPSGTDFYNAEMTMWKDVIVPLTRKVTNNIVLLAMESSENPAIFDYDPVTGQAVSSGNNETKTVEEMTEFMENTAATWAEAAGTKAAKYGQIFNYCGTVGSNNDTRTKAKAYARGLLAYATINETPIPNSIGTTWVSTVFPSDSSSATKIKNNIGSLVNSIVFA